MEYKEIIEKIRPELEKVIRFLEGELQKIRTGRASPALVENIIVDCFGQKLPLKQLAAISCPEPKQILIQPWDKSYIEGIEKALQGAGVGASPIVDKEVIRVTLPDLTEEFRKDLLRILSEKSEAAKQTLRRWREEAWREIQDQFKEGNIREDDKFRAKDELQDLIDEYNEKIEALAEKKRKEITS
ncbi:MAG: ribosome recycling factor [Candidatus Nealsonbacteria bacterium]|nr:MAG: ribosome recycling factor [Candidatus Nealsonbacteria bacterium]